MARLPTTCILAMLVVLGCDRPVEPQPGGSANYSAALGDGPDFSDPHGRVTVETWFSYGETALSGYFADGPALRHHSESERIGNCRLMTYTASSCTPSCGDEELCIQGECQSWPQGVEHGDLLWVWPDGEKTVSPNGAGSYYASGSASTAGDVSITGDDLDLISPTIDAMEEDGDWARQISSRGADDATLRWNNPILDARVRLHMTDCTGSHGGIAAAELECEGPDTGELVIAGAFLDAMDAGDWSHGECGSHDFERYHAAAPEGDDSIRLETVGDGGLFYRPDW